MRNAVQVAWLSGSDELNRALVAKLRNLHPHLPLVAVSEFAVDADTWIPYHPKRTVTENRKVISARLSGVIIEKSALLLVPRTPYWPLRRIAWSTVGLRQEVYDRNLICRPLPAQVGRLVKAWARWHTLPTSPLMRWVRRMGRPGEAEVPVLAKAAYFAGRFRGTGKVRPALPGADLVDGITVVIPSRNGLALLRDCLSRFTADQIIVVDNGSDDGTAAALPHVEVVEVKEPLSFAKAVNLGIRRASHRRVLLLNNDMLAEPGMLAALDRAFDANPDLFCATAQILFPDGQRREETGKAVMFEPDSETAFPLRCDIPLAGEDQTWVLYGSGGCSLFDTAKLREVGGLNEALEPAYVEDLDLGFRGWQRGWASVFCAGARVEHRHRSTTSRYYTPEQLDTMVQVNYLRFLASAVFDAELFGKLWGQAIRRLHLNRSRSALRHAIRIPLRFSASPAQDERAVLALTNGDVAVFPGKRRTDKPVVVIATPYLPFPLSHGGAVRIFNLMKQGAKDFRWVMVAFAEQWEPPPAELLELCDEIVLIRRRGSHYRLSSDRPDTVDEFDSPTFHAALRQTVKKWQPGIVQLEWTQMAQYASDCSPAKTILVEHDVTFDLYTQMAQRDEATRDQLDRWRIFETAAWQRVDRVIAMSEKDRNTIGDNGRVIPNGVDTDRYAPASEAAEPNRILFIGSFAHHPNRSAVEWFIHEVWPLLSDVNPILHIIAGKDVKFDAPSNVFVDGFVSDVRPAYRKAAVVIAPLVESAGTNLKILEALAMGKPVVSTTAGVNGLDVPTVSVADSPEAFAEAIRAALSDPPPPSSCSAHSWRRMAEIQTEVYRELMNDVTERNRD